MFQKRASLSFRPGHAIQYAWDDITARKTMTSLSVFAVGVIVAMFLTVGFYAVTIYLHEQTEVGQQLNPAIAAKVRDVTDVASRFTETRMKELERLPGVAPGSVFPKLEIDVKVSFDPSKVEHVRLEGAIPGLSELSEPRLSWGRSLTKDSRREVLLSESLFRKLGGRMVGSVPDVKDVVIEVGRTSNGQTQVHRQTCSLVGILRHQRQDKVHVPLQMAIDLDLWCTHKIDALGADAASLAAKIRSPALRAYVPVAQVERVADECRQYAIQAEKRAEVTTLDASGEIWAAVRATSGEPVSGEQGIWLRDQIPGVKGQGTGIGGPGFEVWAESWFDLASLDPGRSDANASRPAVALAPDDPRWRSINSRTVASNAEVFLTRNVTHLASSSYETGLNRIGLRPIETSQVPPLSSKAVCFGLRETLQFAAFDPVASGVARPITAIATRSIDLARKLQHEQRVELLAEPSFGWAIHDVGSSTTEREVRDHVERVRSYYPGVRADVVLTDVWEVIPRRRTVRTSTDSTTQPNVSAVAVRFLPDELFRLFVPADKAKSYGTAIPFLLVSPTPRDPLMTELQMFDDDLIPIGQLAGATTELWMSQRYAYPPSPKGFGFGLAIWGSWTQGSLFHMAPARSARAVGSNDKGQDTASRQVTVEPAHQAVEPSWWKAPLVSDFVVPTGASSKSTRSGGPDLGYDAASSVVRSGGALVRVEGSVPGTLNAIAWKLIAAAPRPTFRGLVQGDAVSWRKLLNNVATDEDLREYSAVPLTISLHGRTLTTWVAVDDRAESSETPVVFVNGRLQDTVRTRLQLPSGYARDVKLVSNESVPGGVALVDRALFHRLAFELANDKSRGGSPSREEFVVRVADVLKYRRVCDQFAARGLTLKSLVPLREETLVEYVITDPQSANGSVDAQLLGVLSMTKPTFAQVLPLLSVPAKTNGAELSLQASSPFDPLRFSHSPTHGRWLREGDASAVILPASFLQKVVPRRSPESWVGRTLEFSFQRATRMNSVEPDLKLSLAVVGVTESDVASVPGELVSNVTLWREGSVTFRNDRQSFEAPVETYTRVGHIRCNLEAVDLDHVAGVVAQLEQLGYATEHQLATQEGLRRLGWLLTTAVVALASLMAVFPWITVLVTSWMSIYSKTHEIGILKSHGVSRFEIARLYAIEALLIGAAAFLAGSGLVIVVEPLVRHGLATVCSTWLPVSLDELFTVPITAPSLAWLFAIALPAALGTTLTGVLIPAWWASGLTPVEAFRKRE